MFNVPIDKIIPVTNARAQIASLVKEVQKSKSLYVLTRGGKPAAVLASIDYIHNNSLAKSPSLTKSIESAPSKETKATEPIKSKPAETEPILANTNNVDSSVDTYDAHNNVTQKYDQEQPVRISIK